MSMIIFALFKTHSNMIVQNAHSRRISHFCWSLLEIQWPLVYGYMFGGFVAMILFRQCINVVCNDVFFFFFMAEIIIYDGSIQSVMMEWAMPFMACLLVCRVNLKVIELYMRVYVCSGASCRLC